MIKLLCLACLSFLPLNSVAQQTVLQPTEVTLEDLFSTPILEASCHNYCFLGICVWLRCTLFSCSIETSEKIGHNNPDLVVSVYDFPGNNPFQEAEDIFGGSRPPKMSSASWKGLLPGKS